MPYKPISHSARRRQKLGRIASPERRDKEAVKVRNSALWQRIRRQVLNSEPLCRDPFDEHAGVAVPTAEVHHIEPLNSSPELAYERINLAGLCVSCHRRVDQMNRDGKLTRHLFRHSPRDEL